MDFALLHQHDGISIGMLRGRFAGSRVTAGYMQGTIAALLNLTPPRLSVYQRESKTLCQSSMSTGLALPPEVWGLTLDNFRESKSQDELIYLWTTLRHVCRQFKATVEELFKTQHLPRTFLHFKSSRSI